LHVRLSTLTARKSFRVPSSVILSSADLVSLIAFPIPIFLGSGNIESFVSSIKDVLVMADCLEPTFPMSNFVRCWFHTLPACFWPYLPRTVLIGARLLFPATVENFMSRLIKMNSVIAMCSKCTLLHILMHVTHVVCVDFILLFIRIMSSKKNV